jgi:hypothetical protein
MKIANYTHGNGQNEENEVYSNFNQRFAQGLYCFITKHCILQI